MANKYPYPDAEHLEPISSPYDVVDEELRLYPNGAEFREGLIGISRIYDRTSLLTCFKKYARLLTIAQVTTEVSGELDHPSMAANFYMGEVFATHVWVQPMPKTVRQYVLGQDILDQYGEGTVDSDPENFLLKLACTEMLDFRDHDWRDLLNRQNEQYQEKLFDATVRLYADVPNVGRSEDDFMAGYLFASNLICLTATSDTAPTD